MFRILAWMKAGQACLEVIRIHLSLQATQDIEEETLRWESAIEGCLNGTAILDVWYEVIGLTPTKNPPILYYAAASRVSI